LTQIDPAMLKGAELWGVKVFCPLSADWGNVADWAGAIASLAAVIAALFIAFRESWSLKKQRLLIATEM